MHKETILPFSWKSLDEQDMLYVTFYQVTFLEDFGIIRKHSIYECIDVDYNSGIIVLFDLNGDIIGSQSFVCTPI